MPRFEVRLSKPVTDYLFRSIVVEAENEEAALAAAITERTAALERGEDDDADWSFGECGEAGEVTAADARALEPGEVVWSLPDGGRGL